MVGYRESVRRAIGWCELRRDFRMFRIDRIAAIDSLDDRYLDRPVSLRQRWLNLTVVRDAERQAALPPINAR